MVERRDRRDDLIGLVDDGIAAVRDRRDDHEPARVELLPAAHALDRIRRVGDERHLIAVLEANAIVVKRREIAAALRDAFEIRVRDIDQRLPGNPLLRRDFLPPDGTIDGEARHRLVALVAAQHRRLDLGDLPIHDLEPRREHRRQTTLDDRGVQMDAAGRGIGEDQAILAEAVPGRPKRIADRELDAVLRVAHVRRERHRRRIPVRDPVQEALGEFPQALVRADDLVLGRRRGAG